MEFEEFISLGTIDATLLAIVKRCSAVFSDVFSWFFELSHFHPFGISSHCC